MSTPEPDRENWRRRLAVAIFESDTLAGKAFDVGLIAAIVLSVCVVMLESVASWRAEHGPLLRAAEWLFTVIFTIEYGLRLVCVPRPVRYARSSCGVVDLLATVPTDVSALVPGQGCGGGLPRVEDRSLG